MEKLKSGDIKEIVEKINELVDFLNLFTENTTASVMEEKEQVEVEK